MVAVHRKGAGEPTGIAHWHLQSESCREIWCLAGFITCRAAVDFWEQVNRPKLKYICKMNIYLLSPISGLILSESRWDKTKMHLKTITNATLQVIKALYCWYEQEPHSSQRFCSPLPQSGLYLGLYGSISCNYPQRLNYSPSLSFLSWNI